MSILVSIAAYRDPELLPTIRDCIRRARHPGDLRFGICWQHGSDEKAPAEFADPRMRVIDVPWRDSRGACWARSEIMTFWQGEEFFLQLDSHHRFVADWDVKLIAHAERSGAMRPILSTYGAPFDPRASELSAAEPMQMDFDRFTEDGIPLFLPRAIPGWAELQRPLRARFVSAHFLFAPGEFARDVPYDPALYFHGEEIMLAIRAFTHGYDLFHPPEHIVWHEYTRSYRTKHWDDHVRAHGVEVEWHTRDAASREKVRRFLTAPHSGPFGCGAVRTFAEYEAYAGLNFQARKAQNHTLRGSEPPLAPEVEDWADQDRTWQVRIQLDRDRLSPAALADPQFWYLGFHDAGDRELYREDAAEHELQTLLAGNAPQIVISRQFHSSRRPVRWTVWPCSRSEGWVQKIVGTVDQRTVPDRP
jgi:hypothetical protein